MCEAATVTAHNFGIWTTPRSTDVETMPKGAIEQGLALVARWERLFPLGDTWVGREHGVPSLIVRLDCVVSPSGELGIYEVEERPCGIGMEWEVNPFFRSRFEPIRRTWPSFSWVQSPTRATDDVHWLGEPLALERALEGEELVLVRSRPEETDYHPLESRSISSVSREGCKAYGLALGLWDEVRARRNGDGEYELDPPLIDYSFLRPVQATRARGIYAHVPPGTRRRKSDKVSLSRLGRVVAQHGVMYRQPFIPPMEFPHQRDRNGIYRFFIARDLARKRWVPVGGMWAASPSIIVHGNEDTIFGPLHFEE